MPQVAITSEMAKAAAMQAWKWFENKVKDKGDRSFSSTSEAYGVLLEEFHELVDAVRSNDHAAVRIEIQDLFVPCLFELASWAEREQAILTDQENCRVHVSETKAFSALSSLQILLGDENTCASLHDILGRVAMEFRSLETKLMHYDHLRLSLEPLAVACLAALASFESGKMDW